MNRNVLLAILLTAFTLLATGCGNRWAGVYEADVRLMPGETESGEPGYTLAEVRERVLSENRTLELKSSGRFVWNTGSSVNQGTWRIEEDTLILRDDNYDGTPIAPSLRSDRRWRITGDGAFVTGTYTAYNLEEIYRR